MVVDVLAGPRRQSVLLTTAVANLCRADFLKLESGLRIMASIVDAAECSNSVYNLQKRVIVHPKGMCVINPQTWDGRATVNNTSSGFKATLYRDNASQYVLAFAGTDDLKDALIDDLAITLGAVPPQAAEAITFARSFAGKSRILVTGHSLGGALAIIAAAHADVHAVTFNAPGVTDSCSVSAVATTTAERTGLAQLLAVVGRCSAGPNIRNIRIGGDPVSSMLTTGLQPGKTTSYPAKHCGMFNMLCKHGMQACLNAVRGSDANYVDIT